MKWAGKQFGRPRFVWLIVAASLIGAGLLPFRPVYSADLPNRSVTLSDSRTGTTAQYALQFDLQNPQVLGSIKLEFCGNTPLFGQPCTTPFGLDVSGATLVNQVGETGFIVLPSATDARTIVLSRVPSLTTATTLRYEFISVINPTDEGSFYVRLQTFSSGDASGSDTDHSGIALSINRAVQVSTVVPPYLLFCGAVTIPANDCGSASGSYINFGTLTSQSTLSATSQLLTATNAANGFTISANGLTMTSGNNVIDANAVPDVSRAGVNQFGLNLVANSTPNVGQNPSGPGTAVGLSGYNQPNFYTFRSGDAIAGTGGVDDYRHLTISYIVNMRIGQPVGIYVATVTYTCLANF